MNKVFIVKKTTELFDNITIVTNFKACTTKRAAELYLKATKISIGKPAPNETWEIEELELLNSIRTESYYNYMKEKAQK